MRSLQRSMSALRTSDKSHFCFFNKPLSRATRAIPGSWALIGVWRAQRFVKRRP